MLHPCCIRVAHDPIFSRFCIGLSRYFCIEAIEKHAFKPFSAYMRAFLFMEMTGVEPVSKNRFPVLLLS
nr:MAG TPA: tRNA modification GTPase mnmE [Caudoviricetes sp.]